MSSIGERPAEQLGHPGGVRVDADDLEPGLHEREGERQADVAEADDGDGRILAHASSRSAAGAVIDAGWVIRG